MTKTILITGGAGFIGSHLTDFLVKENSNNVIILDNLDEQVHQTSQAPPKWLSAHAKFIKASIMDYEQLKELFRDIDIIIHLAAAVGVGQSMYQVKKYVETNILGTGNILDILTNCEHHVQKLIIASSNTIYGEGKYECNSCGVIFPPLRTSEQLSKRSWELSCPNCGRIMKATLSDETTPFNASSIYAFSKQAQEQMTLMIGNTYGIKTTILRFFLVYGSRQSLSNPYTGVCGIFATKLLNNTPPLIYEDGLQTRDFVHVKDICQAINLAIEKDGATGEIFNVGTGIPVSIKEVAEIIIKKLNPNIKPIITQKYRVGDIRHCVADVTKIRKKLGYKPTIMFNDGIDDVLNWIKVEKSQARDNSEVALYELKEKGLLR